MFPYLQNKLDDITYRELQVKLQEEFASFQEDSAIALGAFFYFLTQLYTPELLAAIACAYWFRHLALTYEVNRIKGKMGIAVEREWVQKAYAFIKENLEKIFESISLVGGGKMNFEEFRKKHPVTVFGAILVLFFFVGFYLALTVENKYTQGQADYAIGFLAAMIAGLILVAYQGLILDRSKKK